MPMIATRTLSSLRARPFDEPLDSDTIRFLQELAADVEHALDDRDPRRDGEERYRPGQHAPGSEDETGGDDDDALGAGADADVAPQPERRRAPACLRDENPTRPPGPPRRRQDDRV